MAYVTTEQGAATAVDADTPEVFAALARKHLPADIAEQWLRLLRPAAHLRKAGEGDALVGQLGGLPRLPEDVAWPEWEGCGPLSFVAAVDCAALLAVGELDIPLRTDGWLAFFSYDDEEADHLVDAGDPDTWAGARVLHLPRHYAELPEREAPDDAYVYRAVPLTVRSGPTAPDLDSAAVDTAFGFEGLPPAARYDHPVGSEEFTDALWDLRSGPAHRIGGHAEYVQDAVEEEVARGALGRDVPWSDPRIAEEARRWVLLAQFDTDDDADMMWGDCGVLYWLIRPEDLAANRFEEARLTWQCG
ncbi:YwqG family protein [Actinacidiphila sp. SB3-2]